MSNQASQNTMSSFENVLKEFKDLTSKDISASFLKGALWGLACLVLIGISSFLVDVMRTRIFYSSNLITTYPQRTAAPLPQTRNTVHTYDDITLSS